MGSGRLQEKSRFCNVSLSSLAGPCLCRYLIRSSVCRWLCSRRFLSVFSRLCSKTFSSSRCLSALSVAISLCCLSRCLSASSWTRASRVRACWSSSSRREHCSPHEGAASEVTFSFLSLCWITDSILHIWEQELQVLQLTWPQLQHIHVLLPTSLVASVSFVLSSSRSISSPLRSSSAALLSSSNRMHTFQEDSPTPH